MITKPEQDMSDAIQSTKTRRFERAVEVQATFIRNSWPQSERRIRAKLSEQKTKKLFRLLFANLNVTKT